MFEITLRKRGPTPKLLARELNNINREAARAMGQFWHSRYFKKHFTLAGASEYGYAPREGSAARPGPRGFKRSYTGKKLARVGHTRPLEYTGESRERASHPRIVATARRGEAKVRVIMNAPTFNFRRPGSSIDMRKELTTVSRPEADAIANETGFFLQAVFSKIRRSEVIRLVIWAIGASLVAYIESMDGRRWLFIPQQ